VDAFFSNWNNEAARFGEPVLVPRKNYLTHLYTILGKALCRREVLSLYSIIENNRPKIDFKAI
jgi:hypothetical protein